MSAQRTPTSLAAGLGMAMAFLQKLTDQIVALGGYEEMLQFLTTERGLPTVQKIAELIVKSDWRVPRSLVERLTATRSREEWGDGHVEFDMRFSWQMANLEKRFGIPTIGFGDGHELPIPRELNEQLVGKPIRYPLIVEWMGEPYVVVGFAPSAQEDTCRVGLIMESPPEAISVAPAGYFDLNR
jgi:hypothetical protein